MRRLVAEQLRVQTYEGLMERYEVVTEALYRHYLALTEGDKLDPSGTLEDVLDKLATAGELCQRQAKEAGKLARSFELPAASRDNFPGRIDKALKSYRERELFPAFPFGSDFTETEQTLIPALQILREASVSKLNLLRLAWEGVRTDLPPDHEALARMGLDRPKSLTDRLYRLLLLAALSRTAALTSTAP